MNHSGVLFYKKGMNVFRPITRRSDISLLKSIRLVPVQRSISRIATVTAASRLQRSKDPSAAKSNPTTSSTTLIPALFATTAVKPYNNRSLSTSRPNYTLTHTHTHTYPPYQNGVLNMAPGIDELVKLTSDLQLDNIRDKFPACYPEVNPIDVYRAHLTNILEEITGVDRTIIYNAIQWTQGLDKGDLIVAAPALRVKGKKPDELAKECLDKVSLTSTCPSLED